MNVTLKNVRYRDLLLTGKLEVALHVSPGIKHRGYAFGIIADQVGKFGDAVCLDAFKYQGHKFCRLLM